MVGIGAPAISPAGTGQAGRHTICPAGLARPARIQGSQRLGRSEFNSDASRSSLRGVSGPESGYFVQISLQNQQKYSPSAWRNRHSSLPFRNSREFYPRGDGMNARPQEKIKKLSDRLAVTANPDLKSRFWTFRNLDEFWILRPTAPEVGSGTAVVGSGRGMRGRDRIK